MEGRLKYKDRKVKIRKDPNLYYEGGYGRLKDSFLELSIIEAAYLLNKGDIDSIDDMNYEDFISNLSKKEKLFFPILRVYSDLRKRGYYLQHLPGDRSIKVYARGEKPSKSSPEKKVLVLREKNKINRKKLKKSISIIDSDDDITYFNTKKWDKKRNTSLFRKEITGKKVREKICIDKAPNNYPIEYFGEKTEENKFLLPPLEARYLRSNGILSAQNVPEVNQNALKVYSNLRNRGLFPKTGFKFGFDFRVHISPEEDHSEYLIEIKKNRLKTKEISGKVRLAHSVRKKCILAFPEQNGLNYIEIERWKP